MLSDEQQAWIDSRPPKVRQVVIKYPPTQCYRAKDNPGHYWIHAYSEPLKSKARVTLKIIHGRDSYLPGVMVFGVAPSTLKPCKCGKWEFPTEEQTKQTKLELSDGVDTN